MAMPRAPIDPYCRLSGRGARVAPDDADKNLAALAEYAAAHGVNVWRYPDGKLALTSEQYARALNRGRQPELAPLVFGSEGDNLTRTVSEAFSALREQSDYITQSMRAQTKVEGQVRAERLDPVESVPDPIDIAEKAMEGQIAQTVRTFTQDVPTTEEVARDVTGWRWLGGNVLAAVESSLNGLGEPGKRLAALFGRRNEMVERIRATAFSRLQAQLERLNPEEIASGYAKYVEKGIVANESRRNVLESVYNQLNDIDEQFYNLMKAQGVEVAPRVGAGPLNPTGRYFPHRRDLSALGDRKLAESMVIEVQERAARSGVQLTPDQALDVIEQQGWGDINRNRAIDRLIGAAGRHGSTLERADAERLLDSMLEGADRISGSLERQRVLNTEGYITDVRRAYTATWTRNAYRLADVATFGKGDAKVWQELDALRHTPNLGPRAHKFAKEVYDIEIGRKRLDPSPLFRELYGWQAAKLSLALLANSTQSFNTFIRVGTKPFVKALRDAMLAPGEFGGSLVRERSTVATRSGALPVQMYGSEVTAQLANSVLSDVRDHGMTSMLGPRERAIGQRAGNIVDFALQGFLAPFRWVENWNRSVAQRAGEYYFDQIAEQLARRGEAGLTHRAIGGRLRELNLTPERVLDAVRRGDADSLAEMRVLSGLRTSNETQFRSDYQSMPLWANSSEPGRFLMQYKNFAINQTRFVLKEVSPAAWRRDKVRAFRALATIGLAYPAVGIYLTKLRQDAMGPTLSGEQLASLLEEPTTRNLITAGAISMTLAGSMGILADIGMTAAIGNSFAMRNFFIPPGASTIINGLTIAGSTARGIASGDEDELYRARGALLREFGGIGATVEQRLQQREGRAEEPIDLTRALRRAF